MTGRYKICRFLQLHKTHSLIRNFRTFSPRLVCGLYCLTGLTIPVTVNLNRLKATKAELTSVTQTFRFGQWR
jgi:hypothetical protein